MATATPPPSTCKKAVLIVEDEPLLLMEAADMVADAGYLPIETTNAKEALAVLRQRGDICILFTDINLAGSIDGLALAREVADRWPPIDVIVASGRHTIDDSSLPHRARFMPKPYLPSDFNRLLADFNHPVM
ncbi:response regulator [Notoacmeibacter ruber]|uniref:Response regulator n=1 Tax=Notoacmeibacter ruber TaxID=2670375 RepID=A0A3L7JF13_9HYPH|nr:response regulator [Notoacmeibacter ruber]RLQ89243.1 response regulator [Notoacmeibacter ruber]